ALNGNRRRIANILVQDLCPGRFADHLSLAFDGAVYGLVLDALDHRGPADTMPGTTRDEANTKLAEYGGTLQELLGPNGPKAEGEPPLAGYTQNSPGH